MIKIACINKPGSHMPPMYLRRSRRYSLGQVSDEREHAPPATEAIRESSTARMPEKLNLSQLRRHAGGKDWDEQCCRLLLVPISEQYPRQYRGSCRRCIGGILEPGFKDILYGTVVSIIINWFKTSEVAHRFITTALSRVAKR